MASHTNHNDALAELAELGHSNSHSTIDLELAEDDGVMTVTLYESTEHLDSAGRPVVTRGDAIAQGSGPFYVDALNALLEKVK